MPAPTSGEGGPIVVAHILKTAGTTLRSVIRQNTPPDALLDLRSTPGPDVDAAIEQPTRLTGPRSVLVGHVGMGLDEVLPGGARYVTVLREPVDRYVSHYGHARRTPGAWLHEAAAALDLAAFVESDAGVALANLQTSFLADPRRGRAEDGWGHLEGWEARYGSRRAPTVLGVGRPLVGTTDPDDLQSAARNLDRCVLVGVAERFDETLLLVRSILGWRSIHVMARGVTGPMAPARDVEVMRRIAALNTLDLELYAAARDRFDRSVLEVLPDVERQLDRYRRWNPVAARYGRLLERARGLAGRVRSG